MTEAAIGAGALVLGACLPNLALGAYAGARKFWGLMKLEKTRISHQIKAIRSAG